jgi:hypothetical protein
LSESVTCSVLSAAESFKTSTMILTGPVPGATRRFTLTRLHRFTFAADAVPGMDWKSRTAKQKVAVSFTVYWDLDSKARRISGL